MSDHFDSLKTLHTRLIDSRDGYKSSRESASETMSALGYFDRRIAEREQFHTKLHQQLQADGVDVSESGSAAATAHRGWLKLKDAVTGSDDKAIYDEIVTGEKELLSAYDDAISACAGKAGYAFLTEQRAAVNEAINQAQAEKARHG